MAEGEEINPEDFEKTKDKKKSEGSPKNPLLTILVLVNSILVGAVGWFQFQSHIKQSNEPSIRDVVKAEMKLATVAQENEEVGKAKEEDGILFPLETFTANLAQGDGPRRFVRLNAVLKFNKDASEDEFKGRKPQIRDTIISILNSKRPTDLLKVEGKEYLKEEIKAAINTYLVDGHVIDVFYVGFQIN